MLISLNPPICMIFFCDAFDAHSTPMLCVYEISWWRICSHPNKKPTYLSYLWGWKTNSVFDFFIPPSSMMSTCLNLFRRLGLISISEGVVCFNFFFDTTAIALSHIDRLRDISARLPFNQTQQQFEFCCLQLFLFLCLSLQRFA